LQAKLDNLVASYTRASVQNAWESRGPDFRFDLASMGSDRRADKAAHSSLLVWDLPFAGNLLDRELADHASEALEHLLDLEVLAQEQNDRQALADLYGLQARVLSVAGRWQEALDLLRKQKLEIAERRDRNALEENYGAQAIALGQLGYTREAAVVLNQHAIILGMLQFEDSLGYAHWNWGVLAALRGEVHGAKVHFSEAEALLEGLGRAEEARRVSNEVAEFFGAMLGRPSRAHSEVRSAEA